MIEIVRPDPPPIDWEEIVLDSLRVRATHRLSSEFLLDKMSVVTIKDTISGSLLLSLETEIFAEKLAEKSVTVSGTTRHLFFFPDSPWQHFKQKHKDSWWLGWLVRRRPVLESYTSSWEPWSKTVTTEQFATFPESPIRTPPHYRGAKVVRYERTS